MEDLIGLIRNILTWHTHNGREYNIKCIFVLYKYLFNSDKYISFTGISTHFLKKCTNHANKQTSIYKFTPSFWGSLKKNVQLCRLIG